MTARRASMIAICALVISWQPDPSAYVLLNRLWPNGNVAMQLQLGTSGTLMDGFPSWGASAGDALAVWNQYTDRVDMIGIQNSTAPTGSLNGQNNVFFSSTVYGMDWDANALAITISWTVGSTVREADVIFNNRLSWNSYRGPNRQPLFDFHRVALHEFGHVLGLGHPNESGQNVVALMNSRVSDLDGLAADDIAGARALYGTSINNGTVAFPPRNDVVDFRNQLETYYRNVLRRGSVTSFVDMEGEVVWGAEYARYYANGCDHATSVARVLSAIDGNSSSVCASAAPGDVRSAPRNFVLDFFFQLQAKYRDGLRRPPVSTVVDTEGVAVWLLEYLRYRVNGCGHADAAQKVFLQLDGRGVQPLCEGTTPPAPTPGSATLTGRWRGVITSAPQSPLEMVLTQTGNQVTGTFAMTGFGNGQTDPAAPGRIDAGRNFEIRFKLQQFSDFIFRGTLAADGASASGGVFQSGFNGDPFTMTRQ